MNIQEAVQSLVPTVEILEDSPLKVSTTGKGVKILMGFNAQVVGTSQEGHSVRMIVVIPEESHDAIIEEANKPTTRSGSTKWTYEATKAYRFYADDGELVARAEEIDTALGKGLSVHVIPMNATYTIDRALAGDVFDETNNPEKVVWVCYEMQRKDGQNVRGHGAIVTVYSLLSNLAGIDDDTNADDEETATEE